jgi:hypothetical protein
MHAAKGNILLSFGGGLHAGSAFPRIYKSVQSLGTAHALLLRFSEPGYLTACGVFLDFVQNFVAMRVK